MSNDLRILLYSPYNYNNNIVSFLTELILNMPSVIIL